MTVKSFDRVRAIGFRTVAASALTAAAVLGGTAAAQATAPAKAATAAPATVKAPAAAVKYCQYKVTTPAGVNIRSGPGTSYPIVGTYAHGKTFWARAATVNGWRYITSTRYVTADHTAQVTSTPCQYS
ncbi:SH3 domain-containing protein [Streptomyces sp. P11-1]|uniref:SH3 domain-containing protein n=1 Tax=Streptomyces sp. P11-1 TaxID=3423221 RepID=UPI003D2EE062